MKPFAVLLYEEHVAGKTADDLAREHDIPCERIEQRIRAARAYLQDREAELRIAIA